MCSWRQRCDGPAAALDLGDLEVVLSDLEVVLSDLELVLSAVAGPRCCPCLPAPKASYMALNHCRTGMPHFQIFNKFTSL